MYHREKIVTNILCQITALPFRDHLTSEKNVVIFLKILNRKNDIFFYKNK